MPAAAAPPRTRSAPPEIRSPVGLVADIGVEHATAAQILKFRVHDDGAVTRAAEPALNPVYKGFPTLASNTSPWVDRAAIGPGMVFIGFSSACSLVHAARRCLVANGADGVTTSGHCAAFFVGSKP